MSCARVDDVSADVFDAAFQSVGQIHQLMSLQSPASALNRLNRAPLRSWVELDPEVVQVLEEAQRLAIESNDIFNPCFQTAIPAGVAYQVEHRRARRLRDCRIDLSGIAKGYAVDRAVALLEAAGLTEILVNAGGDMRHSGVEPQQVLVRDASDPTRHQGIASLCNAALASSVNVALNGDGLINLSTVRNGRDGAAIRGVVGASVVAPTALLADVLAKVMLIEPIKGLRLCHRYGAHGISFEPRAAA